MGVIPLAGLIALLVGTAPERTAAEEPARNALAALQAESVPTRALCGPEDLLKCALPFEQSARSLQIDSPLLASFSNLPGVGWVFDTSNYPPRWQCGTWAPAIGWLHILSDIVIWLAYLAIPIALLYFSRKRREVPFKNLFWLFGAFIVCCGTTHLMEAIIFWWPAYGLAGVIKFVTAGVSAVTVVVLAAVMPEALALRNPKQLEQEVRRRTRELEFARRQATLIVEASPAGMVMINKQGRIVMVNAAAESLFGYNRNELLDQPVEALIPHRFRANHPQLRNAFFDAPETRRMGARHDLSGLRKDGSEFPVEVGLRPIETEEGMFVLSAVIDVTDQRLNEELERRVQERTLELSRRNRELEQFAYVASHDLQEPLRKVASCCQTLEEDYADKLNDDAREWIRFAVDGATRMRQLVSDLLDFSRVETRGKVAEPSDSHQACQLSLDNLTNAIEESDAEIICRPLPTVLADSSQLTQLFQNLIGNSIKYCSDERPVIEIGAEPEGKRWRFYVKDNGIGIAPEYHERIFEIFQRLHRKEDYAGTGIGLAICRKVVERLGGQLWVKSQLGEGSTFYFTLSAAQPQNEGANDRGTVHDKPADTSHGDLVG